MNESMGGWMNGCMDGRINRWIDGVWMDEWMDGLIDG